LTPEEISKYIQDMPDDVASHLSFSTASTNAPATDADGFPIAGGSAGRKERRSREDLQDECWTKFHENPQINTAVRGQIGRLTGMGFESTSAEMEIQNAIEDTEKDHRNRLWDLWPKFTGRALIEGELFLSLTIHRDGFVEVDFIDPKSIQGMGDDDTGIIYHSRKPTLPLFYNIRTDSDARNRDSRIPHTEQVPSINIARFPEYIKDAKKHPGWNAEYQKTSKGRSFHQVVDGVKSFFRPYRNLSGYNRFIVEWNKGLCTRRATAYLRTTIKWINHYERLKEYEIDHKKSSSAHCFVTTCQSWRDYKNFASLPDDVKKKSGLAHTVRPGDHRILPPGFDTKAVSPNLPSLSGQDTDIMDMVSSGLNEPQDIMTGRASGTFASVKAQKGPYTDRISDEIAYFERWLKNDFWSAVFYLKSASGHMSPAYISEVVTGFTVDAAGNHTEETKEVLVPPEALVDISFPISENTDLESMSKAYLGVKHGPLVDSLGVPRSMVAKRLGFPNYRRLRLLSAQEKRQYPELALSIDQEKVQETLEAEPSSEELAERTQ
jgi:hypothetical protein